MSVRKIILTLLLFFVFSMGLKAADPYYFETPHFTVYYYKGVEFTARRAAAVAEEIYGPVTSLYGFQPSGKVKIILKDSEDYSNGGAYYFDSKIEIWAANLDFVLRGTHDWLRDVITHEFTHIVSIQKGLKLGRHIPGIYLQYFGYEKEKRPDVVRGFPDKIVSFPYLALGFPVWFAEGVAQYQSNEKRFDYRDSHREMVLRDRVLSGKMLSLNEMNTFGKNSVGNESSYNLGFAFVTYLSDTYGEEKISELAGEVKKISNITFETVMTKVFSKSPSQLYDEWLESLQEKYRKQTENLHIPLREGEIVDEDGFGNIMPVVSPDGKKVAYLSNKGAVSFGNNALVIAEKNGSSFDRKTVDRMITSSITWSPDGRYLVYAKRRSFYDVYESYNDLYLYDCKEDKSYRISRNARLRNPDWNPVKNTLVAVTDHDGSTNLVLIDMDVEAIKNQEFGTDNEYGFDLTEHKVLKADSAEDRLKKNKDKYRLFNIKSPRWRYLTSGFDGRQFYHPRWSPDGKKIITDSSIEFTRDIVTVDAENGRIEKTIHGNCDYRNPVWDREGDMIYFASDSTGIFNIYAKNLLTGQTVPVTNVTGGAFWPSVDGQGKIWFALYKNRGYGIRFIESDHDISVEDICAIPDYARTVPHVKEKIELWQPEEIKTAKPTPSTMLFFPRLLYDYGTVKAGFYIYSSELVERLNFIASFDVNADKDFFYYAGFQYNLSDNAFLKKVHAPSLFFDIYNQISNIKDKVNIPQYYDTPVRNVNFNLLEMDAGFGKINYFEDMRKYFSWKIQYRFSYYKARLDPFWIERNDGSGYDAFSSFHYTYLKGHAAEAMFKVKKVKQSTESVINPQNGYYISFSGGYYYNRFLTGFDIRSVSLENYTTYKFLRGESEVEFYRNMPWFNTSTFDVKVQAGFTSAKVDSFFNFFAGGLIGLKGYPFYSVEGRNMAIASFYYRFPVWRNINKRVGIFYFKHLYMAPFFQTGSAWDSELPFGDALLQDVGWQTRLEITSFYYMPIRLFYEVAYPLSRQVNGGIVYPQEVKHYIGLLFSFDLRMSNTGNFRKGL